MAKQKLKILRQIQDFYPERSRRIKKGVFITFEGPEGCGKSTHSKLLSGYLTKLGYSCVNTREPGGTKVGEEIRDIVLGLKSGSISDITELFLFEAARAAVVEDVIKPALDAKKIVICDRFSDATLSYQGYGGGVDLRKIMALDRVARGGIRPDLTILLDIDVKKGLRRAGAKGRDRMERKAIAYHERVRAGYLYLASREPRRIKIVRVADAIEDTQAKVRREVDNVVQRYSWSG